MTEQEKAIVGAATIKSFVDQFGEPDQAMALVLEILMEELYNASPIHLFGRSQQEGPETSLDDQGRPTESGFPSVQSEGIEPTTDVGIQNLDDHR